MGQGVGSAGPKGSEADPLEHHSTRATGETEGYCLSAVASVVDPGFADVSLDGVSEAAALIAAALQDSAV